MLTLLHHLLSGVSSEISRLGGHQALFSLPSTPRKEVQRTQVKFALSGVETFQEVSVERSVVQHNRKRNSLDVSSTDNNVVNTFDHVPTTSNPANPSSFASKTHEILNHFCPNLQGRNLPLISSDVAIHLLKIQSSRLSYF